MFVINKRGLEKQEKRNLKIRGKVGL